MRLLAVTTALFLLCLPAVADTLFTPYQAVEVENAILKMVDSARSDINMACYGFTDTALCEHLIQAHARGVNVRILMDKSQAAGKHQKVILNRLKDAGIEVVVGRSPSHSQLLHSKFIVVDSETVESGSLNYSTSGLQQSNFVDIEKDDARAKLFLHFWQEMHDDVLQHKHSVRKRHG